MFKTIYKIVKKQRSTPIELIITGFALVMFWRGVWGLLDLYLLPGYPVISYILSIFIGLLIIYIHDSSFKKFE